MTSPTVVAQAAFLSCGLLGLGLVFLVIGALANRPGNASRRWPSTPRQVTSSQVGWDAPSGREAAQIRYTYHVNGQEYQAGRISFRQPLPFSGAGSEQARQAA